MRSVVGEGWVADRSGWAHRYPWVAQGHETMSECVDPFCPRGGGWNEVGLCMRRLCWGGVSWPGENKQQDDGSEHPCNLHLQVLIGAARCECEGQRLLSD